MNKAYKLIISSLLLSFLIPLNGYTANNKSNKSKGGWREAFGV